MPKDLKTMNNEELVELFEEVTRFNHYDPMCSAGEYEFYDADEIRAEILRRMSS